MTTATRLRLLARLGAWWRWRQDRPDIEDEPDLDPYERHEAWLEKMSDWEARRP